MGKQMACRRADPIWRIDARGGRHAGRNPVAGPGEHAHWHRIHDLPPVLPEMKLRKVVRPHQPDKAHAPILAAQGGHGLGGRAGSQPCFDVGDIDARVFHDCPTGIHPALERCRTARLERVARRYKPPDPIQPETGQGLPRNMHMPFVRRIKRSPEQADGLARSRERYRCGHGVPRMNVPCSGVPGRIVNGLQAVLLPPGRIRIRPKWRNLGF